MQLKFYKYQGTGNDFVMIDDRDNRCHFSVQQIQSLCDRRFGIGADGVILIRNHADVDFEMVYYNSDGSQSFCGNGSRCALAFAETLGIFKSEATFIAIDGKHIGKSENNLFHTKMGDVSEVEVGANYTFINTGSPHYVIWKDDLRAFNLVEEAKAVRYNERFKAEGTNVNFVKELNDGVQVRTYERGVEDETLSCGTGVTAVTLAHAIKHNLKDSTLKIKVEGGELNVSFERDGNQFKNIWLIGPAVFVFEGEIEL
jgi:diaminopimelate epimerase